MFERDVVDVVVVGGGVAGLAAAAYLAQAGRSVQVLEKAGSLGGRAATQQREGYAFNLGAHAIYPGGAAIERLQELGVRYDWASPKQAFVLRNGRFYPGPTGPVALLRSGFLSAGDKLELLGLFAKLSGQDPRALARQSARAWIESVASRPRVRQYLAAGAQTLAYSTALDLVSAEVVVDRLKRVARGPVRYLEGGWQTLVDGLARTATGAGAAVQAGARVEAVEREGGRAAGVRLADGRFIRSDAVILATTPREAARLVEWNGSNPLREVVDALVPSEVVCLDVALSELPNQEQPVVQDLEHPLFCTAQSRYVSVAPPGGGLIHAFKVLDPRRPSDPRGDERDLEGLLDIVQPGWRDRLVKRVFMPHMLGSSAVPLASNGGFAARPAAEVPTVPGLYLAGDWIGPDDYLVDASMASAHRAATLALQQTPARLALAA